MLAEYDPFGWQLSISSIQQWHYFLWRWLCKDVTNHRGFADNLDLTLNNAGVLCCQQEIDIDAMQCIVACGQESMSQSYDPPTTVWSASSASSLDSCGDCFYGCSCVSSYVSSYEDSCEDFCGDCCVCGSSSLETCSCVCCVCLEFGLRSHRHDRLKAHKWGENISID